MQTIREANHICITDYPSRSGSIYKTKLRPYTVEAEPVGGAVAALTEGEVAAESSGRIPPQAMMMLSTI